MFITCSLELKFLHVRIVNKWLVYSQFQTNKRKTYTEFVRDEQSAPPLSI